SGPVRCRSDRGARRRYHRRDAPARGHGNHGHPGSLNMTVSAALAPGFAQPVVALVGNPNCGKTALFNALTGSRQKVANYPGVTVERKSGNLVTPAGRRVQVLDLPGTYSLRARSPDEVVTRDVVLGRLADEAA